MVEGVESINRNFHLGRTVLAASRSPGVAAPAFGSAESEPPCKLKANNGVSRPYSRIASDSRWTAGRNQIAVVKVAGGDIEGDSGIEVNATSTPQALDELI